MQRLVFLVIGLVIGLAAMAVFVWKQGPRSMLQERASPHALEETVTRITDAAKAEGWVVQGVIELDKSIKKNGGGDVRPVRLVNLCQAKHAAAMMKEDDLRRLSVFMPCTIAVYTKQDGKTYVASMNARLLGRLWGGLVAEVMGHDVADAQEKFVNAGTGS